jgi:hypothetical protein
VERYREPYQQSRRRVDKSRWTNAVLQGMREIDARFLRPVETDSGSSWVELTDEEAYEKASHALRSAKGSKVEGRCRKKPSAAQEGSVGRKGASRSSGRHPKALSDTSDSKRLDSAYEGLIARQREIFESLVQETLGALADERDDDGPNVQWEMKVVLQDFV